MLHLVAGAPDLVREAHPRADVVPFTAPLTELRVPPLGDLRAWLDERHAAWSAWSHHHRFGQTQRDDQRLLALPDADAVTCWVGDTIQEQLMLAWLVAVLDERTPIHVARLRVPGRFTRAATTPPDHFATAPITPLSAAERAAGRDLWTAFTAPEPSALFAFLATRAHGPFDAMPVLADRFPDRTTGLDAAETAMIRALADHPDQPLPRTLVAGFLRDDRDALGDMIAFGQLLDLVDGGLLANTGGRAIRDAQLTLTAAGQAVLAGRANRTAVAGIDRWIGGAHLTPATPHYRP